MAKDIMEMSAAELKQLRAGLPGDHDPNEVQALNDRIVEVSIEEGIQSGLSRMSTIADAKTLDGQAYKRWPELSQEDSDFRKAVNKELEKRGDSATNPNALNDAANKVGLDRGMVNHGWEASSDTAKIMGIKGPGDPDGNGREGKSYTEKNADILEEMSGFIDTSDENVLARINSSKEQS